MAVRPRPRELSDLDRHIRQSWQRQAEEQGLLPVAAWWRWRLLQMEPPHICFWLKAPLRKD